MDAAAATAIDSARDRPLPGLSRSKMNAIMDLTDVT
jgi:hypothetical protein